MGYFDTIEEYASLVDARIEQLLSPTGKPAHKLLYDAMLYSVKAGGKRLRPYLTLEFCSMCSSLPADALDYAAAIEMIHTMSLIHDDLPAMDDDDIRRGKPTNHRVYGEGTAILAGDTLLCEAFRVVAQNEKCTSEQNIEAVSLLAIYGGRDGMMAGQQIDLQSEKKEISITDHIDLVEKKTSALFMCACVLGCTAAQATDAQKEAAAEFGRYLGLSFQTVDDILDCEGDEKQIGKSTGKDELAGKSTFVSLLGIQESKRRAYLYNERAIAALEKFPDGEEKTRLIKLVSLITERKF